MTVFPNISPLKKNMYKKTVNGFVPNSVIVPLKQDVNADCKWLVKPGDKVSEGQIIAVSDKNNGIFSSVYSPIPGIVTGIESCVCPDGRTCEGMRIQLSGSFSFLGKNKKPADVRACTGTKIFESINEKGIINTFVTNEPVLLAEDIQRAAAEKKPVMAVRLFDEDPSRLTDSLITQFFFENVFSCSLLVAKAMNAAGIIFVADRDFELPELPEQKIPVLCLKTNAQKYPSGYKEEIIRLVQKNSREEWTASISKKSLFTDSSTMLETYRAFSFDMPVIDRYVHISGDCIPASGLIKVSIGTTLQNLAEQCGSLIKNPKAIIVNGLVSGVSAGTLTAPVTKYVKSVVFLPAMKTPDQRQSECIRCGNCRRVCPKELSPDIIFRNLKNRTEKKDDVFMQSAFLCDNCGLCNASCPARLPLCHVIYRKKSAPVSALPLSEKKAVVQTEELHQKKGASDV